MNIVKKEEHCMVFMDDVEYADELEAHLKALGVKISEAVSNRAFEATIGGNKYSHKSYVLGTKDLKYVPTLGLAYAKEMFINLRHHKDHTLLWRMRPVYKKSPEEDEVSIYSRAVMVHNDDIKEIEESIRVDTCHT